MNALVFMFAAWLLMLSGPSSAQEPPARVVTAEVTERFVSESIARLGVVDFDRVSNVSSEISGIIDKQHLREGQVVKQGDILVELNTDFIRKDIDITHKEIEEVGAERQKEENNYKRLKRLIQSNVTSRLDYEDALFTAQALTKKQDTLRERISRLELRIAKSQIRAPFDGVILEKFKEQGEWLGPETAICRLASTEDALVKVAVSQDVLKYQVPGTQILVDIGALGKRLTGRIQNLVPVADLRSKNVLVKVKVPYVKGMMQNMSASVAVPVSEEKKLRIVKRDALIRFDGKDFVYTVKGKKAQLVPINIVTRLGTEVGIDNIEVIVGMPVVVDGNDRLKPNQPVTVIESTLKSIGGTGS